MTHIICIFFRYCAISQRISSNYCAQNFFIFAKRILNKKRLIFSSTPDKINTTSMSNNIVLKYFHFGTVVTRYCYFIMYTPYIFSQQIKYSTKYRDNFKLKHVYENMIPTFTYEKDFENTIHPTSSKKE